MATDPLRNPRLRVKWAKSDISKLERALAGFLEPQPYSTVQERDAHRKQIVHMIIRGAPIPTEIPMLVSQIVHDLRSALDLLACCLAKQNGFDNVSGVSFPFGRTSNMFDSTAVQQTINKLSPKAQRLIRRLKPYKGGNNRLYALYELDITDKRIAIVPIRSSNSLAMNSPNVPLKSIDEDVTPFTAPIGASVDVEPELRTGIGIRNIHPIGREPIVTVLTQFIGLTERIIRIFERTFF